VAQLDDLLSAIVSRFLSLKPPRDRTLMKMYYHRCDYLLDRRLALTKTRSDQNGPTSQEAAPCR